MQANEHDIEHANDGDGVLDAREQRDLDVLTKRYEKLCEPGPIAKAGRKAVKLIPSAVKDQAGRIGHAISEQELYQQAMDVVAKGFKVLEQQAARLTVTPGVVVRQVNDVTDGIDIEAIDDVCMARSYDIARLVNAERGRNLLIAAAEGGKIILLNNECGTTAIGSVIGRLYIAKYAYPELFADVDVDAVYQKLCTEFFGKDFTGSGAFFK